MTYYSLTIIIGVIIIRGSLAVWVCRKEEESKG